jgi:hypothetical protein
MKRQIITLAILLVLASAGFVCPRPASSSPPRAFEPEPQRRAQTRRRRRAPARTRARRVDYSKFSHRTPQHRARACDTCHTVPTENWPRVRAKGEAFPDVTDYPGHASCMDCHRRQFFSGARPVICSVCHTNVSPRDGTRHPFRNPSEAFRQSRRKAQTPSEFDTVFPHDRHQDVMARLLPDRKSVV